MTECELPGDSWWIDDPIGELRDDRFGRAPFVERAVALLNQISVRESSTVIGLVGPWGSGKTSTLRMIVSALNDDRWGVAWINPWALSGPDAVVAEMLGAIRLAIPDKPGTAAAARRNLERYGTFAAPLLSMIPVAGGALETISKDAIGRLAGQGTLEEQAQKVASALSTLARPILIVIDDVDRLQPDQLLAVFRAVRALGRLPNVHYMLAYDQQTVLDVLGVTPIANERDARAVAFLEKIVTLRLEQPPVRAEHADSLFNEGLTNALGAAFAMLTEDAQRRLVEERESLLLRVLTEPRSVARLIAQVRIYLPLVGASEVDVVDFVVLTFIRMTYPRLYQALAANRRALVGIDTDEQQSNAQGLFDSRALGRFEIPEPDVARVAASLQRLFPLLGADAVSSAHRRRARRRQRRVSDPDYTERYFALTPIAGDVSDDALLRALRELTAQEPGDATASLSAALQPDITDEAACSRAARVLRRAAAQSEELPDISSAALIPFVIEHLKYLTDPASGGLGAESDGIAWLARLLAQADGIPPADVVKLVEAPPANASSLSLLLRAIRLAVREPTEVTLARHATEEPPTSWLSGLVRAATDAAWSRTLTHVRLGDAAPLEPVGLLITWLESALGRDEIDQRLADAVDAGLPLANLAGRLVEVATVFPGGLQRIEAFDAVSLMRRLGQHRIRSEKEALLEAAEILEHEVINEFDTSWSNRRRLAARRLLDALNLAATNPGTLLPVASEIEQHPFSNHRPSILPDHGEPADLIVQVAVLIPNGHSLPQRSTEAWGPPPSQRESAILAALKSSPITRWLTDEATRWGMVLEPWQINDAEGRHYTTAETFARTNQATSGWRQQTPVVLGAQLRTGYARTADGRTQSYGRSSLLTFCIGFFLDELDSNHRPDPQRSNDMPLPAAFKLSELYKLVNAAVQCEQTAAQLWTELNDEAQTTSHRPLVQLSLSTRNGLGAVADLAVYARHGRAGRNQFFKVFQVQPTGFGPAPQGYINAEDIAAAALHDWLSEDGYRDYEPALHAAWDADSPTLHALGGE